MIEGALIVAAVLYGLWSHPDRKRASAAGGKSTREFRVVMCVGGQGSGKTSVARTLYGRAMQAGRRVVVYDPNDSTRGIWPKDLDADLEARLKARGVDMVVIDDVDVHVRPWQLSEPGPWRDVSLRNRHVGVDLILTARSLASMPPELLSAVDVLYVFQVSALSDGERVRIGKLAPGLVIPTTPYRFACVEPKGDRRVHYGRTLPAGGFQIDA